MMMLDRALRYAAHGWPVFPLLPGEKRPLVKSAHPPGTACKGECGHHGHGLYDATTSEATIRAWWGDDGEPAANIGLRAGIGWWVLDIDAKQPPGGVSGLEMVALLESMHGALPTTLCVRTPGGGEHRYFQLPLDRTIGNRAKIKTPDGRPTSLDVRGSGGYVVAEPSSVGGKAYSILHQGPIAEAPEWLLDVVAPPARAERATAPRVNSGTRYGAAALAGACRRIAESEQGDRHDAILHSALGMGSLVAGRVAGLSAEACEEALVAAGIAAGKPQREVVRTVRDGLARGALSPRVPELAEYRVSARPGREDQPPCDDLGPFPGDDEPAPPAPVEVLDVERMTDLGNARVMVRLHGPSVRWCGAMPGEGWMAWDGARWRADDTLHMHRLCDEVADDWRQRAPMEIEPPASDADEAANDLREAMLAHASRTESARARRAMLEITRSRDGIATRASQWDADDYLLQTPGATYDLRQLRKRAPRREDHITRSTAVDASAEDCPAWLEFLWTIMGGDGPRRDLETARKVAAQDPGSSRAAVNLHAAEMCAFLQRICGYMLTGDTGEQVMFIAYGTGANGKGTFLNAIKAIMGDYATGAQVETFVDRKHGGIPNDLAALAGARFVLCSEPEEGAPLAEGLIKMVTGQDTITARFLNREFFDFVPRFKLWMMTNHKPVVKGTDNGIWRRLVLVPFTVTVPEGKRDKHLPEKLREEYPAILRWMLDGLKAWRSQGLDLPATVRAASEAYRAEMDILGEFIAERCVTGASESVTNAVLYAAYKAWADNMGCRAVSHKALSRNLASRGLAQVPSRKGGRTWAGIGLATATAETPEYPRWDRD